MRPRSPATNQEVPMLLTLALLAGNPAFAEVPSIGLEDALTLASRTPTVEAAEDAHGAARAQLNQARAGRFPTIGVTGGVQVYDSDLTFSLIPSDQDLDCSGIPDPFGSMCAGFSEPTVVREQVTSSVTAQATLP